MAYIRALIIGLLSLALPLLLMQQQQSYVTAATNSKVNSLHAYWARSKSAGDNGNDRQHQHQPQVNKRASDSEKQTENETKNSSTYKIGLGIADITGPAADINMMGYAKLGQDTRGIHTRLYSRALVIVSETGGRVCYVNVDLAASTQIVKMLVIEKLEAIYGPGVYGHENIMISSTHTHSGPGGYFQYLLYIITQEGYIKESTSAIVEGITKSIKQATDGLTAGSIFYQEGNLQGASINRSPAAYLQNPESERAKYKHDTDKTMQTLRFVDSSGKPLGMASWFAVHGTSMNNTNKLISGDNKGYAALRFEEDYNGHLGVGRGPFVAIFGQANEGDSSPNTKGARCLDTGEPCDFVHSTCNGKNEMCIAFGPGRDMFESTKIIGQLQYQKAKELFESTSGQLVKGDVRLIYENINMTDRVVTLANGTKVTTCPAALGMSFAAGTTDGEGASFFQQGTTHGDANPLWDLLRNLLTNPSQKLLDCQMPKSTLIPLGEMRRPYDWGPEVMPTQLFEVGDIILVGLPAEFTTMSGRRIREDITEVYASKGRKVHVILAGLANTYSNYVTTFEEYQLQRYEGGSTLFGPHTLDLTLKPPVLFDMPLGGLAFGAVLTEPLEHYYAGSRVKVRFVGANPRNNMRLEETFLKVERLASNGSSWQLAATDANWETM
ncbi:PREDICTED: neutral ceramidase-like [Rhagoletis zephyria]|uniref:neutral ceramidase-like n=1 Tax=Rhagoletis zephyria TaxID=28612 RepID=UPI000811A19E|nr:PREDICTED: neutral ceramidase-like [Rhagoletis zephyria]